MSALRSLHRTADGRLADAAFLADPRLQRLLDVLGRDGEAARVVGGAVRDALLGAPVADVDVATTAEPDIVTRRVVAAGCRALPTGLAHGTVTVLMDGVSFEVTTLRRDVETDGRHAVVRFSRDFTEDALRRDFTINALSVEAGGQMHDPAGGVADLEAGRVRFIGDPTSGSSRTACASCGSSASMPASGSAPSIGRGSTRCSVTAPALAASRANGSAGSF